MRTQQTGDTLRVSQIRELTALFGSTIKDQIRAEFIESISNIEFDLTDTEFVDSSGLGVLISLLKDARGRNGTIRLVHPQPRVEQIFQLTRMDRIFEIVPR